MSEASTFDHLIVGAETLEQGAAFVEKILGVPLQAGGRHVVMGTHNRLLKLGARAYLEVIAIDPAGDTPARPRWFGLDDENIRRQLHERPRVLTWAARTRDIDAALQGATLNPGAVHPMTRGAYQWRITIPDDGALIADGLMPTLIQWECAAHPADNLEDRGCELVRLEGTCPAPEKIRPALAALGLGDTLEVTSAAAPRLAAIVRSPRGLCTITS